MDIHALNTELQELVAEFGSRPYGFFTILGLTDEPRLDLRAQNSQWGFIKEEKWHSLDLSNYFLWCISDNGDLLWWNGEQTIAMDPRGSAFVSEPVQPRQFIRLVGMGNVGQIFPRSISANEA